ncbi:MAG: ABC transporter ATP-binding protein [Gemmatimonadaceae bacterium]
MTCVIARGVRAKRGGRPVLNGIDLEIDQGRVVGVMGLNGAGKSTLLQALVGLVPADGELSVLGRNPWRERAALMREVSFVADVAIIPRWLRVSNALDYFDGVHPTFNRARSYALLERSGIGLRDRVGSLSKGMIAQLQLALAIGGDARLLVLDEPTLGLDALYRKRFFDMLLDGLAEGRQTVIIATHEIDEIQHVLTDIVFLAGGRVVFQCTSDDLEERFVEIHVHPEHIEIARAMGPMHERPTIGGNVLMFDRGQRDRLSLLGDLRRPSVAALFAALVSNGASDS